MVLPCQSVAAKDPGVLPSAHHEASRIISAELAMNQALAQLIALKAQPVPTLLLDRIRWELAIASAGYSYRNAARQEELRVYELASYASVEASVMPLLPASLRGPLKDAIDQAVEALLAQGGELVGDEISGLLDSIGLRAPTASDPYPEELPAVPDRPLAVSESA